MTFLSPGLVTQFYMKFKFIFQFNMRGERKTTREYIQINLVLTLSLFLAVLFSYGIKGGTVQSHYTADVKCKVK